jgi:hypothetical protein
MPNGWTPLHKKSIFCKFLRGLESTSELYRLPSKYLFTIKGLYNHIAQNIETFLPSVRTSNATFLSCCSFFNTRDGISYRYKTVGRNSSRISIYYNFYVFSQLLYRDPRLTAVGTRCVDHRHPFYPQKLAPVGPTDGGSSVDIFHLRAKSHRYKIWDFHGGDYEECRLLGYKNPFLTSQETHYVSTTELSRLMLCKIGGFQGGDYEECRPMGCGAVWLL